MVLSFAFPTSFTLPAPPSGRVFFFCLHLSLRAFLASGLDPPRFPALYWCWYAWPCSTFLSFSCGLPFPLCCFWCSGGPAITPPLSLGPPQLSPFKFFWRQRGLRLLLGSALSHPAFLILFPHVCPLPSSLSPLSTHPCWVFTSLHCVAAATTS